MNFLGVGPLEIVFLVIIALIVLGPKDMVKAGRTIGRFMRQVVMSENWRAIQGISSEIRNLPTRLMREANLEDMQKDLPNLGLDGVQKDLNRWQKDLSDWTTTPPVGSPPPPNTNTISPPVSIPLNPQLSAGSDTPAEPPKPETEQK